MTSRRSFLASVAAALVLDPERALWVPGKKKIFLPPAPRVIKPMFCVGDIVTFGLDPQRYICMQGGDPRTGLDAQFAFLGGPWRPWGIRMPDRLGLPEVIRPPAANRGQWERFHATGRPRGAPW